MRRDRGMSFSSWDDGSWVRVLKNEDEDLDLLDENIRRDVEQQVDDEVSEAQRRLAEENEENAEFAERRTKKRNESIGQAGQTFSSGTGVIGRNEDNTEETSGKKKKRTDQEILDEYDKYDTGDSPDLKQRRLEELQAEQRRGDKATTGTRRSVTQDIKDRLTGARNKIFGEPDTSNPRLRDREGYGQVSDFSNPFDKTVGRTYRGAKQAVENIVERSPTKEQKDAYKEQQRQAKEQAKQERQAAKEETQRRAKLDSERGRLSQEIRQDQKDEKKIAPLVAGAQQAQAVASASGDTAPDVSATFPDETKLLESKVAGLLVQAQQEIMEGKQPSRKEDTQKWIDLLQTTSPNAANTQKQADAWKKILEAS